MELHVLMYRETVWQFKDTEQPDNFCVPYNRPFQILNVSPVALGCGCEDWIGLAQDRDRWRALVSAVRNLRVS
jgi:hypothetical protein